MRTDKAQSSRPAIRSASTRRRGSHDPPAPQSRVGKARPGWETPGLPGTSQSGSQPRLEGRCDGERAALQTSRSTRPQAPPTSAGRPLIPISHQSTRNPHSLCTSWASAQLIEATGEGAGWGGTLYVPVCAVLRHEESVKVE
ncbi:hypothetical protein C0Q70_13630 [Pomacea canaliculata]|uniref:Uncharacterized protein n=1 Tax=Pomacea canaliculata TaxID=400727 RepID=A0A2T7NXS9_POMCA|nr:hypothetical protein C0Q70_13630 [Pomacea canaliculata]